MAGTVHQRASPPPKLLERMRAVALTHSLDLQPQQVRAAGHQVSVIGCRRPCAHGRGASLGRGSPTQAPRRASNRAASAPPADGPAARRLQTWLRSTRDRCGRGMLRGAESHSPDLMLHAREDPTGDGDQQRLRRDGGGAALPARGRGGRSTGEPGATNRGRGMRRAFLRPRGPAARAATSLPGCAARRAQPG